MRILTAAVLVVLAPGTAGGQTYDLRAGAVVCESAEAMATFHQSIRGDSVAERAFRLRFDCWTMPRYAEEHHIMLVVDTLGPLAQVQSVSGGVILVFYPGDLADLTVQDVLHGRLASPKRVWVQKRDLTERRRR